MLERMYHLDAARLSVAALASSLFLAAGPAAPPVSTHPMTPAAGVNAEVDDVGQAIPAGQVTFPCQAGTTMPACYGPDQVRAAYDVQTLLDQGITGQGRTIVILGAFQGVTVQSDLDLFDTTWGLPAAKLKITAPDGTVTFDPTNKVQRAWAIEGAIDVEWAHAIAPGAKIRLVLAKSEADADILSATRFAVEHNLGDVISQSFGEAESCQDAAFFAQQHAVFQEAQEKKITLVAASGDTGPAQHTCDGSLVAGVSFPASDPLVTAVGGTRLMADRTTGAYQGEVGWGDVSGASGGGFSAVYGLPDFQDTLVQGETGRGLPDVALGSSAFGSVIAAALGGFGRSIGTSAATAEWAGIVALADQAGHHRLGSLNPRLYAIASSDAYSHVLHDISSGNNTFHGFTGSSAGASWDAVTGLGTPDVAQLVSLLRDSEQGNDERDQTST
ncbi:MAG: hypothetical protein E6J08_12575 [Chloroflexi bacterium]|nr:MAG: hypothetical protein E6J08_12575 [Chloroflexota bacterium]